MFDDGEQVDCCCAVNKHCERKLFCTHVETIFEIGMALGPYMRQFRVKKAFLCPLSSLSRNYAARVNADVEVSDKLSSCLDSSLEAQKIALEPILQPMKRP